MTKRTQKKYIIQDTITNTETGEILRFYTGADGYVHDDSDFYFCDGYIRKGCAINCIKKSARFCHSELTQKGNNYEYTEGGKWSHLCTILEITPVK